MSSRSRWAGGLPPEQHSGSFYERNSPLPLEQGRRVLESRRRVSALAGGAEDLGQLQPSQPMEDEAIGVGQALQAVADRTLTRLRVPAARRQDSAKDLRERDREDVVAVPLPLDR